jgi:hypothetical protein
LKFGREEYLLPEGKAFCIPANIEQSIEIIAAGRLLVSLLQLNRIIYSHARIAEVGFKKFFQVIFPFKVVALIKRSLLWLRCSHLIHKDFYHFQAWVQGGKFLNSKSASSVFLDIEW